MGRNIFIIGKSGAGKTPAALFLSKKLGLEYISASKYIKEKFNIEHLREIDRKRYIDEITKYSLEVLKEDVKTNKITLEENKNYIIDSIRNPFDFTRLYNNKKDIIIFLKKKGLKGTDFEIGVDVIEFIADWLVINDLTDIDRVIKIKYEDYSELNSIKEELYETLSACFF